MVRRFYTLDVFTDTPLGGNPLAVVLDAGGLDTVAMQRIAREFNLSETVFVVPADNAKHRARIRIFTPGIEMPFAGHPTVGTAALLAVLDHQGADGSYLFGLEENIGTVACAVTLERTKAAFARFNLPRLPSEVGEARDMDLIARAIGLDAGDIGFENHHPTRFSAGAPFTLVPVRDLRTIGRIDVDRGVWRKAIGGDGLAGSAYVYTHQKLDEGSAFHARMFSPFGVGEDPATGSAAAALAGAIAKFEDLAPGEHAFRIEQGYEMGRPSIIELGMAIEGVSLVSATVAGHAVIISEGTLRV